MTTNKKVWIVSGVVGIIYIIFMYFMPVPDTGGFSGTAWMLGFFQGGIAIAIVIGILGFLTTKLDTSWGVRLTRAATWFGISLAVIFPMTIIGMFLV